MHGLLATGVPPVPSVGHGAFDWSPFLMVVSGLLVAPLVFGIRLTPRSAAILVLGGITLGWLGSGIGTVEAVCVGLIAMTLASPHVRGTRARRLGTVLHLPD